jgi:oligopeptide transport system substrate-binding protein
MKKIHRPKLMPSLWPSIWSSLFLIFFLLFLLSGCTSISGKGLQEVYTDEQDERESQEKADERAKREEGAEDEPQPDEKTLIISIAPPKINLDPLHTFTSTEAQIYTAIYEGLVTYHPFTLEPLPGVARFWELSLDRKVYTFHLRENAKYWNGDPVTAEHFRQTWLMLIDPEDPGEYGSLLDVVKGAKDYRLGVNDDPGSVEIRVPEPGVLEVELEKPAPHFLKILCHHSFSPLHPQMQKVADWKELDAVLGNGPFTIVSSSDEKMVLKKNQLYWDSEMVRLEGIEILYKDDPEWTARAIDAGTLHWAENDIDLELLKKKEAMVLNPVFSTTYFFFHSDKKQQAGEAETDPYDLPKVRRALALLIPWADVRNPEYMYLPTSSLVPGIESYPEIEGITKGDRDGALSLLEKAGFPGGAGLPPLRFLLPEGLEALRIAELMAESWKNILNLEVEIEQSGFHTYYDKLKLGGYNLGVLTWIGDFADPLTFLQMWTGSAALNIGNYRDDTFDDLIDRAATEENQEERYRIMAEAEQMILDQGVVLPIKHSPAFNIIDLEKIQGWFPNPLDIHPFKYLEFERLLLPDGVV